MATMICHEENDESLAANSLHRLIAATAIKEEPMSIGDLIERPALNNRDGVQAQIDDGQNTTKFDCSIDNIKNEVKIEGNRTAIKKPNCWNEDAARMSIQRGERSSKWNPNTNNSANAVGRSKYQCKECGYVAVFPSKLEIHMLKHTGAKPFPCNYCFQQFTQKCYLQNHMKIHVKEFLFSCSVCLRDFDEKNKMMEHKIRCKALRNECYLCQKSFASMKAHLIRHIRVHSGAKPFDCTKCSKHFAQTNDL